MLGLATAGGTRAVELREVPDPVPLSSQAVVQVHSTSLNRGEVRRLPENPAGVVPGWDVAGVVVQAAADGSGPPVGARVAGLARTGAWAQRVAVDTSRLGRVPDQLSFQEASCLPVAGLTAVRALALGGFLLGQRVLVTGASGGVGRFAVQLAALSGARVTAVSRNAERAAGLRELGADSVVDRVPSGYSYDLILEGAGGDSLTASLAAVARRGRVVTFGNSAVTDGVVNGSFYRDSPEATLYAFVLYDELNRSRTGPRDIALLGELVANRRLTTEISLEMDWSEAGRAIDALMNRSVRGKAVLNVAAG